MRLLAIVVLATLTALTLLPEPLAAATQTILVVDRQKWDPVGQGQKWTIRGTEALFKSTVSRSGNSVRIDVRRRDGTQAWFLEFAAGGGKPLTPGVYERPVLAPYNNSNRPAFFVRNDIDPFQTCYGVAGRFLISEVVFDSKYRLQAFAVDFEHWCESSLSPLFGSLRYKSAEPIVRRVSVADSAALKGNAGTSDASATVSLSMPSGKPVTTHFETVDGTAIQGTDYQGRSGSVTFPPGQTALKITVPVIGNVQARGNTEFGLKLRDADVLIGAGQGKVKIFDPNVSQTVIATNSEQGDFIGGGVSHLATTDTFSFTANRDAAQKWVRIYIDGGIPDYWEIHLAAPDGGVLLPGVYRNALRWPFQGPGHPGLDVSGRNRGCNVLLGEFLVDQIRYARRGEIDRVSVDFEQHCEGSDKALFGWIRVNADLHQASITNAVIVGSTAVFTVTLNPVSKKTEIVNFATRDGTARVGYEYYPVLKTLRFAPGQTSKTVSVRLRGARKAGKVFYGTLSATKTPLWIRVGAARLQ